jgi:hypothetical protein
MRAALVWLVATLVLTIMPACANHAAEMPRELHYQLALHGSYSTGAPVNVTFRLLGHPTQALQILKWNTPLEGLRAKIFRVTRNGVDIPYRGRLYKRGDPTRDEYALLAAGGELHADVDLASAYDFTQPGEYRVTFIGEIMDAVSGEAPLPHKREQFTSIALVGQSVTINLTAGP